MFRHSREQKQKHSVAEGRHGGVIICCGQWRDYTTAFEARSDFASYRCTVVGTFSEEGKIHVLNSGVCSSFLKVDSCLGFEFNLDLGHCLPFYRWGKPRPEEMNGTTQGQRARQPAFGFECRDLDLACFHGFEAKVESEIFVKNPGTGVRARRQLRILLAGGHGSPCYQGTWIGCLIALSGGVGKPRKHTFRRHPRSALW